MKDEEEQHFETDLFTAIRDILTTVRYRHNNLQKELAQDPAQSAHPPPALGAQQRPRSVLTNQNAPTQRKSALQTMITDMQQSEMTELEDQKLKTDTRDSPEVQKSDTEIDVIWRKAQLPDSMFLKIFRKFSVQDKQTLRLVCRHWKSLLDTYFFVFHRILTKDSLSFLQEWLPVTPISTLTVCDVKDVQKQRLEDLKFWDTVKHLVLESTISEDYSNGADYGTATLGDQNMVQVLQFCKNVQSIVLNNGALGNLHPSVAKECFDLQHLQLQEHLQSKSKLWTWTSKRLATAFETMSVILTSLVYDGVDLLAVQNPEDFSDAGSTSLMLSPSPRVTSTSEALQKIRFEHLVELQIVTSPSEAAEKHGLISILGSVSFPKLRKFALYSKEYCANHLLYLAVFNFVARHSNSLRHLTLTNPILCSLPAPPPTSTTPPNIEKVLLKSLVIARDRDISTDLELHWPLGDFLLGLQRHLKHLELQTASVSTAEGLLANNYRHLSSAIIDLADTWDAGFDCRCLTRCSQLKLLVLHAPLTVRIHNVPKLPDTLRHVHWDVYHSLEDVRWFSKYLLLAKSIYFYQDAQLPQGTFPPFDLGTLKQFLELPRLEQLYLPLVHEQDFQVNDYCRSCNGQGLKQIQDMFLIDRAKFPFKRDATTITEPDDEALDDERSPRVSSKAEIMERSALLQHE